MSQSSQVPQYVNHPRVFYPNISRLHSESIIPGSPIHQSSRGLQSVNHPRVCSPSSQGPESFSYVCSQARPREAALTPSSSVPASHIVIARCSGPTNVLFMNLTAPLRLYFTKSHTILPPQPSPLAAPDFPYTPSHIQAHSHTHTSLVSTVTLQLSNSGPRL